MKGRGKTVAAAEFKAKCLALLDEVSETGRRLVITKRGRPVAEIIPVEDAPPLVGSIVREEDLISPIDTTWTVEG